MERADLATWAAVSGTGVNVLCSFKRELTDPRRLRGRDARVGTRICREERAPPEAVAAPALHPAGSAIALISIAILVGLWLVNKSLAFLL